MTVQCLTCRHMSLKSAGPMARHGCARCEYSRSPGEYVSATYGRECSKHQPVSPDDADKRRAYLNKETTT